MKRLVRGAAIVAAAGTMGIALVVVGVGHIGVGAQTGTATSAACPAPPQGNQGPFAPAAHADGTIASISGTTITVTGQNNTAYTITTDGNTHFEKLTASSVGAIAVGDFVTAQGTTSGNAFAAAAIMDNGARTQPQGNPGGNRPGGPGDNGQPPAQANGTQPALPANCAPPQGQQQPQRGQQGQPGQPGQQLPGPNGPDGASDGTRAAGVVQRVSGSTLTLSTRDGQTITVTTDSNTKVTTQQQGAFTDLQVGDQIMAMADRQSGTASDATAFTAAMVSDRTAH